MMDEDSGRNPTGPEAVLCQQVPGPMTLLAEETLYAAGRRSGRTLCQHGRLVHGCAGLSPVWPAVKWDEPPEVYQYLLSDV